MLRLKNKVAVVTGGSEGIGLASARRFADEGACVYITGRRQQQLEQAVDEYSQSGNKGRLVAVQGDVTRDEDLDRLYATVQTEQGHLDILFANAGLAEFVALGDITAEHVDKLLTINLRSVIFLVQKALPILADGGSIILNGSMASSMGMPGHTVYAATKAALRSLARTWTVELQGRQIRTNVLSPGPTLTPKVAGAPSEVIGPIAAKVPLGRLGRSEEVAAAALFLACEDSSFVAGVELFADGGAAQI